MANQDLTLWIPHQRLNGTPKPYKIIKLKKKELKNKNLDLIMIFEKLILCFVFVDGGFTSHMVVKKSIIE